MKSEFMKYCFTHLKRLKLLWVFWGGVFIFNTGCRGDCVAEFENVLLLEFRLLSDPDSVLSIAFDEIRGIEGNIVAEDPVLFSRNDTLSTFSLPVPSGRDSVSFSFVDLTGTFGSENTLRLKYQRRIELLPRDCGVQEFINGIELLNSSFDSVRINEDVIQAESSEIHVQIFISN